MHPKYICRPLAAFAVSALLFLSACTSAPPKPVLDYNHQYDFSNVRTVAFYKNSGEVSGDNPLQLSDMQRNRIDDAIKIAIENRGFTFLADASKADLLLTWHLATQEKTDVRSTQSMSVGYGGYGGYGRYGRYGGYNRYSSYSCWSCSPTLTNVSVSNYTEGTFIVDMIDPKLKQSVWRAVTESKLKGEQMDRARAQEAAALIFASFPPS